MKVFVRDKSFFRSLAALAVPICLQNFLTFGVAVADNVMVGQLGETALGGYYDDPAVRKRIAQLAEIARRFAGELPRPADEVLLVADPESLYHVNEKDDKERAFGQHFRNALSKTGVPFDVCTLSDLATRDISGTKVVVCPAAINITPGKRELLRRTVMTGGKTVVWCYAPGLSDGKTLDPARVRDYAGVDYGTPGISTTPMDGWTSVYARDYRLFTPESLRVIIEGAGVKPWTSKPAVVFANDRFLAIHTKDGGRMTIHLPHRVREVIDLLDDRVVASDCDSFTDDFATPDTKLYEIAHK